MNLIEMNILAGALIVIIISIRSLFLNHLPKTTFPILWGIVLVRLLLPFSFDSELSLNIFSRPFFTNDFSSDETMTSYIEENIAVGNQTVSEQVEFPNPTTSYNFSNLLSSETTNEMAMANYSNQINWLIVVWITGIALSATYFTIGYWSAHQLLSTAVILETEFLDNWKKELKLKRSLSILISDQSSTPLTLGILKPKIIIPAAMEIQNSTNFHYVLAHEFYHIKRIDALWKLLAVIMVCIHWFNPFVWAAFVLANRDLEISCDAWVMKKFKQNTKKAYANALISMAEYQSGLTPLYNYFAKHTIEERIKTIMKTKKTTMIGIIAAFAIVSLLTFSAFATSVDEYDEPQNSSYEASEISHTTDSFAVDTFTVIEIVPIGIPRASGDTLDTEEIAQIGADYIWDMVGESIDGMYMELTYNIGYSNNGRESVLIGNVVDKEVGDVHTTEARQFNFTVDSITGEILSFSDNRDHFEQDTNKTEEAIEVAKDYAQRHFSSSNIIRIEECEPAFDPDPILRFEVEDETGHVILLHLQRDTNRFSNLMSFGSGC